MSKINPPLDVNWGSCQRDSDPILAEGLLVLISQEAAKPNQVNSEAAGNYLVSLKDEIVYIGEAKNLACRIRQQLIAKTSTFYKTYMKRVADPASIDAFRVRYMATAVGRKEIEEFGMVNAGCSLNKFQRGKRNAVATAVGSTLWSEVQRQYATIIDQGEAAVLAAPFSPWVNALANARAGIYVAHAPKRCDILYIGESSNVKARHKCHSGQTYFSALRRHVGTEVLGFSLKERNGKAKYFTEDEDGAVTAFIDSCCVACVPVTFGRFELEEHLIRKYRPQLNRKDNVEA
jgi:predicted GIY-YIG superfamily endonuclease